MTEAQINASRSMPELNRRKRIAKLLIGAARVQLYLAFVAVILLLLSTAEARSRGREIARDLGEQWVAQLAPLSGQTEKVEVNGSLFSFGALVVAGTAREALAKVEQDCHEHSGDLTQQFQAITLLPSARAAAADLDLAALTTGRRDGVNATGEEFGDVACALRDDNDNAHGILARLKSFSDTGNLSDLGHMRYIRADSLPGGKSTRLLAIWTDDPLNLERMLPDSGDAAGSDPVNVPRPPTSRRVFSGVIRRSGDGVFGYESTSAPGEALAFYARTLNEQRWDSVRLALRGERSPPESRAFIRDGRAALITATRERTSEPTTIAVVEIEARRVVTVTQ
jgi:hypothetical protein